MLMLNILLLLIASILLDLLVLRLHSTKRVKNIIGILAVANGLLLCYLIMTVSWPIGLLFTFVYVYRFVNIVRCVSGRLPSLHITSVTLRTSVVLTSVQSVIIFTMFLLTQFSLNVPYNVVMFSIAAVSAICALFIAVATLINIVKSRPNKSVSLSEQEYPTVTIAIAARNETPQLFDCLQSVVASDYPKLEVLVFDDNSQDTTAEIIKSFAQDGVRFIPWEYGNSDWLAKNKAYQILFNHASGEILFYIGVDVRLASDTIRNAVSQLFSRNVKMMSIAPKRIKSGFVAIFIQPMRYWWELAFPSIVRNRPPALSTAWLIYAKELRSYGGFDAFKKSITPEEHFARRAAANNTYAFVRATSQLFISTQKTFASQWDTQVRTRYPHAHRRPETAMLQTLLLSVFILLPFIVLPLLFIVETSNYFITLTAASVSLLLLSHVLISYVTNPLAAIFAPINFPIAIALDIVALHVSMYKYEFSKVLWKGRDIAPKKLHVIPKLPDISVTPSSENTR